MAGKLLRISPSTSSWARSYVVFFFYPADFTFVCPTELFAFQHKLAEFEKRDVALVGCSVDSQFSHWKWLNTEKKDGGIKGVTYPLVVDQAKSNLAGVRRAGGRSTNAPGTRASPSWAPRCRTAGCS